MPRQKKADTFMVSLMFASGMKESTEGVKEAIREFVSSQPGQWQIVSLTVVPADQTVKMHEHNGWKIGLTPTESEGRWSVMIELFEPGTLPRKVVSGNPLFHATAATEQEASRKALDRARKWIDDRQPRSGKKKRA